MGPNKGVLTTTETVTATPLTSTAPTSVARSLRPVAIDVAVPLAVYFGFRAAGVAMVTALIAGSIVPVVRSVTGIVRDRRINALAALMLATNITGIVLSLVAGDVRVLFAKDAGISATIAVGILVSVLRGRPAMSAGLRPFVTRGASDREIAWERLAANSAEFSRYERRYSTVWGVLLLAECVTRVGCAFTVPVAMLSWLPTTLLIATIGVAVIVSGGTSVEPLSSLVDTGATR